MSNGKGTGAVIKRVLDLLDLHHQSFFSLVDVARETGHRVPMDTMSWSQIVISVLTGITGLDRKKGADFADGSDVKAANTWEAIDTPRFNGAIKAGTQSSVAGKLASLDAMPFLFFVLWDHAPQRNFPRCRIWCVRPQVDPKFRQICKRWYEQRDRGDIRSDNFQLHPPRGKDSNEIRNTCGNLLYPQLFSAERKAEKFVLVEYKPNVLDNGLCTEV